MNAMTHDAVNADLPTYVTDAFAWSAVTVLQELAQIEAYPSPNALAASARHEPGIVSVVRLLRSFPGTMTLVLSTESARRFAELYLPPGTPLTDEIVQDVAGEFANVIAGQAKTILKGTAYHFTLSIPVVSQIASAWDAVSGTPTASPAISLEFDSGYLLLFIDLRPCPGA